MSRQNVTTTERVAKIDEPSTEAVGEKRSSIASSTNETGSRAGNPASCQQNSRELSRIRSQQSQRSRGGLDGYSIHGNHDDEDRAHIDDHDDDDDQAHIDDHDDDDDQAHIDDHDDDDDDDQAHSGDDRRYDGAHHQKRDKAFLVSFDGPHDPMNPRSHARAQKWLITLIVCSGSFCTTATSASYTQIYEQIYSEWGTSRELATAGLSLYIMGLGLGPMFLAPLSEWWGRRPIYICSFATFVIWLVPCAAARNIQTMLLARFLGGVAGSAFLSVAGGTVSDLFDRQDMSLPMMAYTVSPFLGPEIGPIIGGFINQYSNWRWTFYVQIIWAALQFIAILLFVPETYHPVCLRRKAEMLRRETGNPEWYAPLDIMDKSVTMTVLWSCIRPFQLLLTEPMCFFLCLISAVLLGIIYLSFGSFVLIFRTNYDFSQSQSGLSFLGIFLGLIIGVACDPYWKAYYDRLTEENGGVPEPEYRLPSTVVGSVIVPLSLIGFAFTTYPQVPWIIPILFSVPFGTGVIFCFGGIFANHVETYPLYAASALAANSFARSCSGAAFPLFGYQMFEVLGFQWAGFLLAGTALLLMPFPYIFFKYGKRIRGKSRFAIAPT